MVLLLLITHEREERCLYAAVLASIRLLAGGKAEPNGLGPSIRRIRY